MRISDEVRRKMQQLESRLLKQQERRGEGQPGDSSGCEELFGSPVDQQVFVQDRLKKQVTWKSQLFGELQVAVEESYGLGNSQQVDRFTLVAPIFLSGNPEQFDFNLTILGGKKVKVFTSQNSPVVERVSGDEIKVSFPVEWRDGHRGQKMPSTVQGFRDIDVLFLDTDGNGDGRKGAFIQVEVSIATRNGQFWLCLQQVFAGQVVSTTEARAKEVELTAVRVGNHYGAAVPLFSENAYPGMNFFGPFGYLAQSFVMAAIECGAYVPNSRCVVAKWRPEDREIPEALRASGWTRAWVSWFNPVVGFGFLFCEDGLSCLAHFKQIEDYAGRPVWRGALVFPNVTPMRAVAVKYETQPDGKRKATAVRPI